MKKDDIIKVKIESIAAGGEGIARHEGLTIFVEEGVPEDELEVKIVQQKKNYCKAVISKILSPSPDRATPPCKYFHECGACQFLHIKYEAQLKYKKTIVKDAVWKIGGISPELVMDVIGADNTFGYRNKLQYPVRKFKALSTKSQTCLAGSPRCEAGRQANPKSKISNVQMGYFRKGTHDIVGIDECIVLHPFLNKIAAEAKKLFLRYGAEPYDEDSGRGLVRHILARIGFETKEALLSLVINGTEFPGSKNFSNLLLESLNKSEGSAGNQLKSIAINMNTRRTNVILGEGTKTIWGKSFITEKLGNMQFNISANSFFQVNSRQAVKLFDAVVKAGLFSGKESVLDIYCGTGSISLWISSHVKDVYGIEEVESAILDAKENAKNNNIKNVFFKCGTAEKILQQFKDTGLKSDIIILDPPRSGCSEQVIGSVIKLSPKKIIYVSCDPATLARDIKLLNSKYEVKSVQPVDMFPQTAHIECVAVLER